MSEQTEAGAEPFCAWPSCMEEPALSVDGGESWYCWTHLTDDFLPSLEGGVLGSCVRCHGSCVTWWVRWPSADDLCLHAQCRRRYFAAVAEAGVGEAQDRFAERPMRGAYRRRRRGA